MSQNSIGAGGGGGGCNMFCEWSFSGGPGQALIGDKGEKIIWKQYLNS